VKAPAIEAKVKMSTLAAAMASVAVALLNDIENNHALLGPIPGVWQSVILIAVPPLGTFLAGYAAQHTPRTTPSEHAGNVKG